MTYYRQCVLCRNTERQVAWIPEQFANQDKYLRIRDEDGWKVVEVGSHRQSEDYIQDHERDFLGHRKRTDV